MCPCPIKRKLLIGAKTLPCCLLIGCTRWLEHFFNYFSFVVVGVVVVRVQPLMSFYWKSNENILNFWRVTYHASFACPILFTVGPVKTTFDLHWHCVVHVCTVVELWLDNSWCWGRGCRGILYTDAGTFLAAMPIQTGSPRNMAALCTFLCFICQADSYKMIP